MGLGSQFARNNIIERYQDKDPFWDPYNGTPQYSLLNKVTIPTNSLIRNYQMEKIEEFEKQSLTKFQDLDPIVKESFANIINDFQSDENNVINRMIENFVTKVNSLYYVNKNEIKSKKDWDTISLRLKNLEMALNAVMNELQAPKMDSLGQPTVLGTTLNRVQEALQSCQINSLNSGIVNNFLKHINQLKGDVLEELGVAYFKKLKIPNINSIRLGSVYLKTEQKNRHSGQLIQDLIAYNINSPDILNDTIVEYKPIGSNTMIQAPLSKLFKDIEAANGQSKQIVINDNTYDVLTRLQSLNIQAKSGKNQLPWNQNLSTSVAIGEFKEDNLVLSVISTFKLLHSLNQKENIKQPWTIRDTSPDYNALANYGLATVLNKVLHLSNEGNQYVLTPYGFMSFSQRMSQLLKTENCIALIRNNVVLNNNTLSTRYTVGITK